VRFVACSLAAVVSGTFLLCRRSGLHPWRQELTVVTRLSSAPAWFLIEFLRALHAGESLGRARGSIGRCHVGVHAGATALSRPRSGCPLSPSPVMCSHGAGRRVGAGIVWQVRGG